MFGGGGESAKDAEGEYSEAVEEVAAPLPSATEEPPAVTEAADEATKTDHDESDPTQGGEIAVGKDAGDIKQEEEEEAAAADGDDDNNPEEDAENVVPKHTELQEVDAQVCIDRIDPSSPLFSVRTWEELGVSPELLKGIHAKGFQKPSKIQGAALPLIISENGNLIGQAQNGSGKTATFALAMLSVVDSGLDYPQTLCVCPTRELAQQNLVVVKELGKYTSCSYRLLVPRMPTDMIREHIIVGTPGKILDRVSRRRIHTKNMRLFVLDEADVMIDPRNNMGPQVAAIRRCFGPLQVLLFSATYPDELRDYANQLVPRANKITVANADLTLSTIDQTYIMCRDEAAKQDTLLNLYAALSVGQSIIFLNNRAAAFTLTMAMRREGYAVSLICGTQMKEGRPQPQQQGNLNSAQEGEQNGNNPESMGHEERDQVMSEFRTGVTKVLISTDVLSRGIDVPSVTLVVNYDMPLDRERRGCVDRETYIHRIGRTGRFGLRGMAVNLVCPETEYLLQQLREFYSAEITRIEPDPEQLEQVLQRLRDPKYQQKK